MSLNNLTITTRVGCGFWVVLFLMMILTFIGIREVNRINDNLITINQVNSVKMRYAINFRGSVHDRAISVRDVVLDDVPELLEKHYKEIDDLTQFYEKSAKLMDEMFSTREGIAERERKLLEDIKQTEAKTIPLINKIIDHKTKNNQKDAENILIAEARPLFVEWLGRINQFIDYQETQNKLISDEVFKTSSRFQYLMIILTAIAVLMGFVFALWTIKSIAPLRILKEKVIALSGGDLTVELPKSNSRDEVGEITRAMQVFKDNALQVREMEATQKEKDRQIEEERGKAKEHLAEMFESRMQSVTYALAAAANDLAKVAERVHNVSASNNEVVINATHSATDITSYVETVSSSAAELFSSVSEISQQVHKSNNLIKESVHIVQSADLHAKKLDESSQKIREVIQLIADISSQINLLALNATIESARAGEAGKGFAVVANEVKNLANQTNKSVDEIAKVIDEMGSVSQDIIEALKDVKSSVNLISESSVSIASAVEEQTVATNGIAESAKDASVGTHSVSSGLKIVNDGSSEVKNSTKQMLEAAVDLSHQAEDLKLEVSKFIGELRNS
jgi:methyl-accepting chemotaxis protein